VELQTAALAFGGEPPVTGATEEYDGTSWTSGGRFKYSKTALAGAGTQTAALAFGGNPPATAITGATEEYNGQLGQHLLQVVIQ
jgi:hypothetical protein